MTVAILLKVLWRIENSQLFDIQSASEVHIVDNPQPEWLRRTARRPPVPAAPRTSRSTRCTAPASPVSNARACVDLLQTTGTCVVNRVQNDTRSKSQMRGAKTRPSTVSHEESPCRGSLQTPPATETDTFRNATQRAINCQLLPKDRWTTAE